MEPERLEPHWGRYKERLPVRVDDLKLEVVAAVRLIPRHLDKTADGERSRIGPDLRPAAAYHREHGTLRFREASEEQAQLQSSRRVFELGLPENEDLLGLLDAWTGRER